MATLISRRGAIHFTQLHGTIRNGHPWRLALVDILNHGYEGKRRALAQSLADRFDAQRPAIGEFIIRLDEAGLLTDSAPEPIYLGEPSGALGELGAGEFVVSTPTSLVSQAGQYLLFDHDGNLLLSLSMAEVIALSMFNEPISVDEARSLYLAEGGEGRLDQVQFDLLVSRLAGANLLIPPPVADDYVETPLFGMVNQEEVQALVDARVAAHDANVRAAGQKNMQVVPVNTEKGMAPASLGLVMAYAMKHQGGRLAEKYDFIPMFLTDEARMIERAANAGVFIFSNYLWTVERNLKISAAVKAINPDSITVHGGPSTPSYERDCEMFFEENPHVDIAVRGEGEATFADLLDKIDVDNPRNLDVLNDAPGITYRTADGVHRTADRERIADLNTIPSPYLMGLFDEFGSVRAGAVIETNRGCPYGCTFCDWGSATLSKVRRFDLDRVYAELEWSAKHQIQDASIADANFGMLERDVDISKKIAELRRTYDFPRSVPINYAKNQVRYLREIIDIFAEVGILTEGLVSLQSMDETTLKVIDRSNIKLEKYHEISTEFRRAKLPLAADIMMGLPGSTQKSFSSDLQKCANLDIRVRANKTTLLPNSPMNEPNYRKKHGIVALPGEILMEAASYTRDEWQQMDQLRIAYYLFDGYGLLRYIARFIRSELGIGEVQFYDKVRIDALNDIESWPLINTVLKTLEGYMAPPGSWGLFMKEVQRYVLTRMDMPDDSALQTVLAVQHAHLPAPNRKFPMVLELQHDYASWQDMLLHAREEGYRDNWEDHVPRLSEFGPATLTIEDPNEICSRDIGKHKAVLDGNLHTWELESPVTRARLGVVPNSYLDTPQF